MIYEAEIIIIINIKALSQVYWTMFLHFRIHVGFATTFTLAVNPLDAQPPCLYPGLIKTILSKAQIYIQISNESKNRYGSSDNSGAH